jgi:type III restriction enzyme
LWDEKSYQKERFLSRFHRNRNDKQKEERMRKNLKYQKEAVAELLKQSNRLLEHPIAETLILKAPTGSGKTIMMADFLSQFVDKRKDGKTFSFIWAAPRKLHNQSKEKLERHYEDTRVLQCSNIEDLTDKIIQENEILFLNWESINKKDNVFVRENEQDFNLSSIVDNTLDAGREIILIIDESHHTAKAENSRGLVEIMKPKLTIEVSATPHMSSSHIIDVDFTEVIVQGMIKKEISVNPDLKVEKLEGKGSDEFILEHALAKRNQLKHAFYKLGKDINPLLLIQLPDKSNMEFSDRQAEIEDILHKKFHVDKENGKLAIHLSEEKHNLENIAKHNHEAEVLLFKQAIALGWDCPRAYILVLFREWHSEVFSIQTVGRIIRMPETQHYQKAEELNKGYVYTNVANNKIIIEEEQAKGFYTVYSSHRIKTCKPINLLSCHSKRQREITRLNPSFVTLFLSTAKKNVLKKKLDLRGTSIADQIPVDGTIHLERIGAVHDVVEVYNNISLAKTTKELENAYKYFIAECLHASGMFPEERSVGRVCTALYEYFLQECSLNYIEKQNEIMAIVLKKKNQQIIQDAINIALKEYALKHPKAKNELVEDENWNIPETREYSANYEERKPIAKHSVFNPYYHISNKSKQYDTEQSFIEFLENNKKIEWWFKNADRDGTYFAVPYTEDGEDKPFYIDFIVQLKDGRVGLFDTKSGFTAQLAKNKSDGLQKYIREQNKKGKSLFGGIVIPKDGSFWVFDKAQYQYDNNLTVWEILSL